MNNQLIRAFIALEIPEKTQKEIGKIGKMLANDSLQAKWVKPENIHSTLAFLDSIDLDDILKIISVLEKAAQKIKPINLQIAQVKGFPSTVKTKTIFLDLRGEIAKLQALALNIRKGLTEKNIWFDQRPFSSHLTLGRIKKPKNLSENFKEIRFKKEAFQAKEISLIQSELTPKGPIYTRLKKIFLVGN